MFKCGYLSHGIYTGFGMKGNNLPCCYVTKSDKKYNWQPNNGLLNGNFLTEVRKTAIAGNVPDICSDCVKQEKLTGTSPRLNNKYFDDETVKEVVTEEDVRYLQIRLSNVCNFKCTICSSNFSHLIGKEQGIKNPLESINDAEFNELKEKLPKMKNLQLLIFAGGEPFYNASMLIDLLDYVPKTAEVAAHTNGSVFNKPLLDKFRTFKRAVLTFSFDGSNRFFNYQRSNGNWDDVINNVKRIKKEYPLIKLRCDSTVSCVTFPDLPNFLIETEKLFGSRHVAIHFIQHPSYYQINLLKLEVLNKVKDLINDKVIIKNIDSAINNVPSNKTINDFWNYTEYLKKNRTDINDYVPEIKDLIREIDLPVSN